MLLNRTRLKNMPRSSHERDQYERRAHMAVSYTLPHRPLALISQYLGATYWQDRARLTWLNAHLDLAQSDWFDRWETAARWSSWYARHPELSLNHCIVHPSGWEATLPRRLRRIRESSALLDRAAALFDDIARRPADEQSAMLRAYRGQWSAWRSEANRLRPRVHWASREDRNVTGERAPRA